MSQKTSIKPLPVQRMCMKLSSDLNVDLLIKRRIKFCSHLNIPSKAPTFSRKLRRLLRNLKVLGSLKADFSSEYLKQAFEKITFLPKILKGEPCINSNISLSSFKKVSNIQSIMFKDRQSSFAKLRYHSKVRTLSLKITLDDLNKLRRLRLRSEHLYLKLKLFDAAGIKVVTKEPLFLANNKGNRCIHLFLNLEDYFHNANLLIRSDEEARGDNLPQKEQCDEAIRSIISQANFATKIASISIGNLFFNTFRQFYGLKEFASIFPSLQQFKFSLELDENTTFNIEELTLPHSIVSLDVKLQISIQNSSSITQAIKLLLSQICHLPNLNTLSLELSSNISLLSFFLIFASLVPNCKELKSLKLHMDEYFNQITCFQISPHHKDIVREALPLCDLFENVSKISKIQKVDIKVPVANEKDLNSLGKINISSLTDLSLIIKDQRGFKNDELRSLIRFISKNTNMESLEMNIASNYINDIGIKNFCYQVSKMKCLDSLSLDITSDNVTQSSIVEVTKTIQNHPSISKLELDFRTNPINSIDPSPFIDLVNDSTNLEYLRVNCPHMRLESRTIL